MPEIDFKLVFIAALLALLVMAKLFAGGKPWDQPVRRRRRFGHRGEEGPLKNPEAYPPPPEEPRKDPEKEFFGDDANKEGKEKGP